MATRKPRKVDKKLQNLSHQYTKPSSFQNNFYLPGRSCMLYCKFRQHNVKAHLQSKAKVKKGTLVNYTQGFGVFIDVLRSRDA